MYTELLGEVKDSVHATMASGNYVGTGSHSIQIYDLRPAFWGAQVACVASFISINCYYFRLRVCLLFLPHDFLVTENLTGLLDMVSESHWTENAYVTPRDMSQHAQTCFIAFFPA